MRRITIRRALTWHYRKMHPCVEQSDGLVPLSLFPSWQGCITNTSGYDFRKGQVKRTCRFALQMSAFGPKADIACTPFFTGLAVLDTPYQGHHRHGPPYG